MTRMDGQDVDERGLEGVRVKDRGMGRLIVEKGLTYYDNNNKV